MRNPFKRSKPEPTRAGKTHVHVDASPETQAAIRFYWRTQKREQRQQLRETKQA